MTSIRFFNTIILFFSFSILVAQDLPENNAYQTAAVLIVQSDSCSSQTPGDLTHATNNNVSDYSSSCLQLSYNGTPPYANVWFKATVPSSGKLTIETSVVSGSALTDTILVAYTLSGDTLTEIDCNDDVGGYTFSKIELTGQVANTEIYVMVVEYDNQAGEDYSNGESGVNLGPFNICAFDPDGTLDTPTVSKPMLSYYSNPMGNRLRLESPYQIQSLSIYDLVGREVMRKNPRQQKLTLDTYSLSSGVYLLEVQTAAGAQTVKLVKK